MPKEYLLNERYYGLKPSGPRYRAPRPSMTRMHFRALAQALAETRPTMEVAPSYEDQSPSLLGTLEYEQRLEQWRQCLRAIMRVCRDANPQFDSQRFIQAAEAKEG